MSLGALLSMIRQRAVQAEAEAGHKARWSSRGRSGRHPCNGPTSSARSRATVATPPSQPFRLTKGSNSTWSAPKPIARLAQLSQEQAAALNADQALLLVWFSAEQL